jgi:hypothetical protein
MGAAVLAATGGFVSGLPGCSHAEGDQPAPRGASRAGPGVWMNQFAAVRRQPGSLGLWRQP